MAAEKKPTDAEREDTAQRQLHREIGQRVRFARMERGCSQTRLGRLLGFSHPSALSRYERGVRPFKISWLVIVARELRVSLDWLITGSETRLSAPQPASAKQLKPPRKSDKRYIEEPVRLLRASRMCGDLSVDEVAVVHAHIRKGNSRELDELEIAVKEYRWERDGSEAALRAFQEAVGRQRDAVGIRRKRAEPKKTAANDEEITTTMRRRRDD